MCTCLSFSVIVAVEHLTVPLLLLLQSEGSSWALILLVSFILENLFQSLDEEKWIPNGSKHVTEAHHKKEP